MIGFQRSRFSKIFHQPSTPNHWQLFYHHCPFIVFSSSPLLLSIARTLNREEMSKKVILKLAVHDEKSKMKAMKSVSAVSGIDAITVDMKEGKMTIIGDADPVNLASKLRKKWNAEIVSVGPAKEPEKKEEPKKEEGKKEEPKKEEAKKEEPKKEEAKKEEPKKEETKKEEPKKEEPKKDPNDQILEFIKSNKSYYPYMNNPYMTTHFYVGAEENPNSCVIC